MRKRHALRPLPRGIRGGGQISHPVKKFGVTVFPLAPRLVAGLQAPEKMRLKEQVF